MACVGRASRMPEPCNRAVPEHDVARVRVLLLLVAWLPCWATDPALRARLHAEARNGARVIPYSSSTRLDAWDALAILDSVPGNTNQVRLIYSRAQLPTATFGATSGWNREHLWPNSYGLDDVEPSFSDLHNLRACDANVNSARGNKWYDLSAAAEGGIRAPAHPEAPECTADSNSWEPPAHQRGDIARALFYMAVRYEGNAPNEPDLELVEDVSQVSAATTRMGRLSTLLNWSREDPPDDDERARDLGVQRIQGNRNPFVSDPGLANQLWLPTIDVLQTAGGPVFVVEPTDLPVRIEYAPTPAGPWSPDRPPGASEVFARIRLL